MSVKERPELSERNKYWIPRERFYELKHFCRQYPTWKKAYASLDGLSRRPDDLALFIHDNQRSDPTARCAISKLFFADRMELVEQAAIETDAEIYSYILRGVTEGLSYDILKARYNIPCCRETYYDRYRRFFWLLDKSRG